MTARKVGKEPSVTSQCVKIATKPMEIALHPTAAVAMSAGKATHAMNVSKLQTVQKSSVASNLETVWVMQSLVTGYQLDNAWLIMVKVVALG